MNDHIKPLLLPHAQEVFSSLERYLHPDPLLVVISGPSGVGKDSVIRRMLELQYPFHFVVTTTDRPPRPGEVDGVDYHFVSTVEFETMVADGEMFEHAVVYGQYKGVARKHIRQALITGSDVVMRLDVQGAATIRAQVPQALGIFLAPPSLDALLHRLHRRPGDSQEQRQARVEMALTEMERMHEFDYLVVNQEGCLDETVKQVVAIMNTEKCRIHREPVSL